MIDRKLPEGGSYDVPRPENPVVPESSAPKSSPAPAGQQAPASNTFEIGQVVKALDRGNYGHVEAKNGDEYVVHFVSPDGVHAHPTLLAHQLEPSTESALKAAAAGVEQPPIEILSYEQLMKLVPPRWIIKGFIREGYLVVIYGQPGSAKSFVAILMAISVAISEEFFGHHCHEGQVVYAAAEGLYGLPARIQAATHDLRDDPPVMLQRNFSAIGVPIHLLEGGAALLLAELNKQNLKPKLIVIDTLARCIAGGDENSAKDMGLFIAACDTIRRETGAAVILVHHSAKNTDKERGSSALRGGADVMLQVAKSGDLVMLTTEKQKESREELPIELVLTEVQLPGLDSDGEPRASCRLALRDVNSEMALGDGLTEHGLLLCETLRTASFEDGLAATALQKASNLEERFFHHAIFRVVQDGFVERVPKGSSFRYTLLPKYTDLVAATVEVKQGPNVPPPTGGGTLVPC